MRLASGGVLLFYVFTHLLNHSLGLVSLAAAEAGRQVFIGFWRSLPVTAVFYGALLLHFGLALYALYQRRSLAMSMSEALRLVLGFLVPFLLAQHFTQTRVVHELYDIDDSYRRNVTAMWNGGSSLKQMLLITVAWMHGCLGIHLAFRHRAGYRRWQTTFIVLGTVLPVLAATGYLAMARELSYEVPWMDGLDARQLGVLQRTSEAIAQATLALLLATLLVRAVRNLWARRQGGIVRIRYPERTVEVPRGWSVLEASRDNGIPHLSVCGGRARCSTCRIHVEETAAELPPPSADEQRTLARIGALPGVRLACQLRPQADVRVRPLLSVATGTRAFEPLGSAMEREVVVLFADLRRWTGLSEDQLPFDLVYVLDRYFEAVGDAVREAGGIPNQFIGDSVMALFGIDTDLPTAARQALAAAARIEQRMEALNDTLVHEFGRRLDFGIGIHAGMAAVGTVGYRETRTLTAVGDAVNTASRLQELTKQFGARLVVSEDVLRHGGRDHGDLVPHEIDVRGRRGRLTVYALPAIPRECSETGATTA
ncbi:MAG TPA: adenylate/guanylate cyclase domain-containing protein [Ramlibacter sp.]